MSLEINGWKLPDPDDVGQSEYRALHDLLSDSLEDAAAMRCDPADYCWEVLDNVEAWVRDIKEKLWQVRRGRKMGHMTALAGSADEAIATVRRARDAACRARECRFG